MSTLVYDGQCVGLQGRSYGTTVEELGVPGTLIIEQSGIHGEDDQVVLGPDALEAIAQWLEGKR